MAPHGFLMALDTRDWMERFAAINARYYALDATAVIGAWLKPGDAFLDVGANLGFLSLTASKLVGDNGQVVAVEPNPALAERLETTIVANGITNIRQVRAALGAESSEVALSANGHHGTRKVVEGSGVSLRRGDDIASSIPAGVDLLVKIDVEGYEEQVIAGMASTLGRARTAWLVEVTDYWLRERGGSAESLFATFHAAGYRATRPSVGWSGRLTLSPLSQSLSDFQYDVLFERDDC